MEYELSLLVRFIGLAINCFVSAIYLALMLRFDSDDRTVVLGKDTNREKIVKIHRLEIGFLTLVVIVISVIAIFDDYMANGTIIVRWLFFVIAGITHIKNRKHPDYKPRMFIYYIVGTLTTLFADRLIFWWDLTAAARLNG